MSQSIKNESVQYNAEIGITGTVRGTSSEKFYQELSPKYLNPRQ